MTVCTGNTTNPALLQHGFTFFVKVFPFRRTDDNC